jgi:hypothetical protein
MEIHGPVAVYTQVWKPGVWDHQSNSLNLLAEYLVLRVGAQ